MEALPILAIAFVGSITFYWARDLFESARVILTQPSGEDAMTLVNRRYAFAKIIVLAALAGLEPYSGARSDIETHPMRGLAVEIERAVGFGKMIVAAHLHGPVAGIGHHQCDRRGIGVQGQCALCGKDLSGDHVASPVSVRRPRLTPAYRIGLCTVTSLVPSGKVAST